MNHVKKTEMPADTAPVRTFLIAADGFEEVEGLTVVDLLRRARFVCDIVSLSDGETVTGSHGIRIGADRHFSEIQPEDYDAEGLLADVVPYVLGNLEAANHG